MFKKRKRLLVSLMVLGFLVACADPERVFTVISESFTFQDGDKISKTFSLPEIWHSKSVRFYLALNTLDAATGQFSINSNTFVEFETKADEKPPEAIDINFVLPRSWFKKDNIIVFEHLSGTAIEVSSASLVFREFNTSPYEE